MPTNQEKQKIRKLAKNGESVNTIQEKLELPKSTVYYHFKKEVGQKQKSNQPTIPEDEEFKGELCGIFAGDGNYYYEEKNHKHRVRFTLNINEEYWEELARYLEKKLGKKPHINHQPKYNRTNLRYESKVLYRFLEKYLHWEENKSYSIRLSEDKDLSQDFKIAFLRGLIDTDGHVNPNQRQLKFNSISERLTSDISEILSELNIEHNNYSTEDKRENCKDVYRVAVYSSHAEKLIRKIEPRHPKKQLAESWSNIGN